VVVIVVVIVFCEIVPGTTIGGFCKEAGVMRGLVDWCEGVGRVGCSVIGTECGVVFVMALF